MCRKNEVGPYFYYVIHCAKIRNSVHGEVFEVYIMKYANLCKVWSFKDSQNLLRMFNLHQIFAIRHQMILMIV